jgi:hypothetical protein
MQTHYERKTVVMNEGILEKNGEAAGAAKGRSDERANDSKEAANPMKLRSIVISVDDGGEFIKHIDDGNFVDLEVDNSGIVTGNHQLPNGSVNPVDGTLQGDVLTLNDRTIKRQYTGLFNGKRFIGVRKRLTDKTDQEEGVWVGTKKP